MTDRVRIELDGAALEHNLAVARRRSPGASVVAVVKSDAYGHGAAFALDHLSSADAFAVATVPEGVALRQHGARAPVWVLSDVDPTSDLPQVAAHDLVPVIHEPRLLRAVLDAAAPPRTVVVKVDSGMGRLGLDATALAGAVDALRRRGVGIEAVMSHLANADDATDDATRRQVDRFRAAADALDLPRSLANSAGVLAWPGTHFEILRPGIMLYGVCPVIGRSGVDEGLRPAMTVSTRILSVREFAPGQPVGYGGTFVCARPTRAALLACGYGDGYPRHAPNGTPVAFAEGMAPLIGRVSMDSLAVDVTDLGEFDTTQRPVLWGRGLPVETVADHCGTIAYELFCRLSARPVRQPC